MTTGSSVLDGFDCLEVTLPSSLTCSLKKLCLQRCCDHLPPRQVDGTDGVAYELLRFAQQVVNCVSNVCASIRMVGVTWKAGSKTNYQAVEDPELVIGAIP